jgi:hypothetical protein
MSWDSRGKKESSRGQKTKKKKTKICSINMHKPASERRSWIERKENASGGSWWCVSSSDGAVDNIGDGAWGTVERGVERARDATYSSIAGYNSLKENDSFRRRATWQEKHLTGGTEDCKIMWNVKDEDKGNQSKWNDTNSGPIATETQCFSSK